MALLDYHLLAALPQPHGCVLADRLQHSVARLTRWIALRNALPRVHQTLVRQRGHPVEYVQRRIATCADRLRGSQGPATGEDRQPSEEHLLRGGQEGVAPV